jgi:hypothetical protein
MEIILAIVVASAVIFFGALISMGNERQRKAIDNLREQVVLWAMQDLQIKKEQMVREVKVEDPKKWLNDIVFRFCHLNIDPQTIESFDQPATLFCSSADGQKKFAFTLLLPSEIRNLEKSRLKGLDKFSNHHPLFSLPGNANYHELTSLNSGMLFDRELVVVWKMLTGTESGTANRLWMYQY